MNSLTSHSRLFVISLGRSAVATFICASLLLSGCSTMQGVAVPTQPGEKMVLQVGDEVNVQTRSGQTLAFKVTQIEDDALAGKDVRVRYRDIDNIQVRRVEKTSKGTVVVIVVGVALAAGLISVLSHGVGFMPSGPS